MNISNDTYQPKNKIRFLTATSLFDGHDAAINIFRRILQANGAEVIHLGHNRSVNEIVEAAIEEDVQGIAVSSYQGGHMEFFKYMIDLLKKEGAGHIKVFGGGGGVIIPEEAKELEEYGVCRIYTPEDGRVMGLKGIVNHMLRNTDFLTFDGGGEKAIRQLSPDKKRLIASSITAAEVYKAMEDGHLAKMRAEIKKKIGGRKVPVVGITGTGGSGKSSLTDEFVLRTINDLPNITIAILSVDPSKRRSGGALLGDRIRMNAIDNPRVYMRSLATRASKTELAESIEEAIQVLKASGFDLIFLETAGIGQGDTQVTDFSDVSIYVMTSEYGAATQLEKIDMLDFADLIAINKFEQKGSEDALRAVRKQYQRNHELFEKALEEMPVYGTIAAKFNDDGVTALYQVILEKIEEKTGICWKSQLPKIRKKAPSSKTIIIPSERVTYLREIAETVRKYHRWVREQAQFVRKAWQVEETMRLLREESEGNPSIQETLRSLEKKKREISDHIDPQRRELVNEWPQLVEKYSSNEYAYEARDKEIRAPLKWESLSGTEIPKVCLPKYEDPGEILKWLLKENVPGSFPYTAGVFPLKRTDEEPTRMFAGEGDPARTNRRFKYLSKDYPAKRLSTAFDSSTLYGEDPDERPDIYGKIGNAGVSVCTLDDMKILYSGFDLCSPNTSVSMTINGPAPMILAMFLNTAIDQQIEKFEKEYDREPSPGEAKKIKTKALRQVRGTVQADILKEDQGQNTCIFSTEFALRMMGDIQEYFVENSINNFYSVSISGYHIAEAGANPITQLAFTLANGFTYLEYYLSRGLKVDEFAPNFSFFFSNGLDPEYNVIGRVARRIWAIALREKYGANERSQKLKYHIQTSGRSLHAQEIQFNDIRTTLQALSAIYDNCNSLHTNSYDEAITTPTEESVRRALAIQLIINREWGLAKNENPLQGSFIIEELTDLVEEEVLKEFERISERGGVLGAMEWSYQRNKIQDESLLYEQRKHSGELPIIGVNTFLNPDVEKRGQISCKIELSRSTEEEKRSQLRRLREFQECHKNEAPHALAKLKKVAMEGGNIFAELMETVRFCSLGQITQALYEVGGQYRRNI
ncbi:MAG: fused isobutyryl-CoA mutase/GTPase IcmF [Pseudomonadota bacterium]